MTDDPPASAIPTTDEELLKRFRAGDRAALGKLAQRHERELVGLAIGIIGGPTHREAALEAVQETWLRVIRSSHTFKGDSSVKTWLYRIAINAARDFRQRAARRVTLADNHVAPEASHTAEPSDHLAALRAATDTLSDDQRLLVLLCYHRGLTHPQAAEVLNLPLGTLKSRLHAALTALRAALAQEARP